MIERRTTTLYGKVTEVNREEASSQAEDEFETHEESYDTHPKAQVCEMACQTDFDDDPLDQKGKCTTFYSAIEDDCIRTGEDGKARVISRETSTQVDHESDSVVVVKNHVSVATETMQGSFFNQSSNQSCSNQICASICRQFFFF